MCDKHYDNVVLYCCIGVLANKTSSFLRLQFARIRSQQMLRETQIGNLIT